MIWRLVLNVLKNLHFFQEWNHNLNSILLFFRRIHLVVDTPKEIRKIQNVIGLIEGETEPGRSLYHFTKQVRETIWHTATLHIRSGKVLHDFKNNKIRMKLCQVLLHHWNKIRAFIPTRTLTTYCSLKCLFSRNQNKQTKIDTCTIKQTNQVDWNPVVEAENLNPFMHNVVK